MHLHILGICGTFMGGIAALAHELGHRVSGSDANVYPPMSTQLDALGIHLQQGYLAKHLEPAPDLVIIGNALSRGNPAIEAVLNRRLPYVSGPQWLAEHALHGRHTLAVSGTHGKTTTSSILAWLLEDNDRQPGFLIGGVPENFGLSARLGNPEGPFVIEADEYDTAFFDKRSKFVHYRPQTAVINNIEFDHADIFTGISDIRRQFHHFVRTVPGNGRLIAGQPDSNIDTVLDTGCWTPIERFGSGPDSDWHVEPERPDYSRFTVFHRQRKIAPVQWSAIGRFNAHNAVAAIAAAACAGVDPVAACASLGRFRGVRRRMQLLGRPNRISVYDDFAHHPSAIECSVQALRQQVGDARIFAVLEPRSNTMRMGVHRERLAPALADADISLLLNPAGLEWSLADIVAKLPAGSAQFDDIEAIIKEIVSRARPGDHVLIMSNGSFAGLHEKLIGELQSQHG